jgi:hypothetical protein
VSDQLGLTKLNSCLHQSSLTSRKATGEQLYGIEHVYGLIVTVIGMEMGRMVRPHFAIHAINHPVEATELRLRYCVRAAPSNVSLTPRTAALTTPPPIILDFRSDAIGGSASNALLSFLMGTFSNVRSRSSALAKVKDRSTYSTEG